MYYLQSNIKEWGITDDFDTLTIGLPMMQREDGPGMYVHDALRFTIDAGIQEGLLHKAEYAEKRIGAVDFAMEYGEFSPVSGIVRIVIRGDQLSNQKIAQMWGGAIVYGEDREELCYASVNFWDYNDPEGIRIEYTLTPPAAWPDVMYLSLPDRDGKADPRCMIPIRIKPVEA